MKVEITEQPQQVERKYPYVGRCGDITTFFIKKKTGFVLLDSNVWPKGYLCEDWSEEMFTPLPPNSVTITI